MNWLHCTNAKDKFRIGQRVVLSELGRRRGISKRSGCGVVVGFPPSRLWCITLRRDGMKSAGSYSADFWDVAPAVCYPAGQWLVPE